MDQARIDSYRSAAELAADEQRGIQKRIDELDAKRKDAKPGNGSPQHADAGAKKGKSVQDGARKQPASPLPQQHQKKPGDESQLRPAPNYEAPQYLGSEKLAGKVALITGAGTGIGRTIAEVFAAFGGLDILVNNAAVQLHRRVLYGHDGLTAI